MTSMAGRVGRLLVFVLRQLGTFRWPGLVGLCATLATFDCGSSQSGSSDSGPGAMDSGGSTSSSSGSSSGGSGSSSSGTGGSTSSSSGSGSGSSGVGGSSSGSGSSGGDAGATAHAVGDGAGGGDGSTSCAGGAISFNLNVPTNNDPAMQRVMVDLGTDLPLGAATRTVEFWAFVLPSTWRGDSNTVFEYGTVTTNGGFGFDFGLMQPPQTASGTIDPYTNGPGTFDNDNQLTGLSTSMSQWIHFAMTWDGTAVRAFVNGVEKATKTSSGNTLATARTQLTIGGNPRGAYFNGYLDEFRMWSIARTATDIQSTMHKTLTGSEAGLVGYWKFDETTGSTAADSTTATGHTAHNGTLMSATSFALPLWIASTAPISCP